MNYKARRDGLRALIGPDAAAIVASPPVRYRSADGEFGYRANSNVLYLTGFSEPDTVALILPEGAPEELVLFVPPRDPEKETWHGRRAGVAGAVKDFGASAAYPIEELREKLAGYIDRIPSVFVPFSADWGLLSTVIELTGQLRNVKNRYRGGPRTLADLNPIAAKLRVCKEAAEIELMRKAAAISVAGHRAAADIIRPGTFEYQVEAAINHAFRHAGAVGPAYPSIVGTADNATILHYVTNDREIGENEAVLVDAGAEYAFYRGDITRTYPSSGTFTSEQRSIYEIVLAAEKKAIEAAVVGNHFKRTHEVALEVIIDGLKTLGFLSGSHDEIVESGSYKKYFLHGTSHFLGLDTHDVGDYYQADDTPVPLRPGMVLTVEPGIYIAPDNEDVPASFRGIGVRIEDDILVTEDGYENLTAECPKELSDVEHG